MKSKTFLELNSDQRDEYKKVLETTADKELKPLVDDGLVNDLSSEPDHPIRPVLKDARAGMKKRLKANQMNYSFAGDISKIDELLLRKRKNLDKPLTIKIKGIDVLLTFAPFIYLLNTEDERVNERLDKMIEAEKAKSL